jgi:5-methyltetrahydrofolate--homocysteine methyltransferase
MKGLMSLAPIQSELLVRIAQHVENGKADAATDIPRGSKGRSGAVEAVREALEAGIAPPVVLEDGLLAGLRAIGKRFAANEAFIPELLVASRAMKAGVAVLRPLLAGGKTPVRGVFVVGTVRGDLHDIGKNLVGLVLEGAGWQVEDLGLDCTPQQFVDAVRRHPGCAVGLSALLTTTMLNMRSTIAAIRAERPDTCILVGGAPLTAQFAADIGANGYGRDPTEAVTLLDRHIPAA